MKIFILYVLSFLLLHHNAFSQGKLYQVCTISNFKNANADNCKVKRVSIKKEKSLLEIIPSLSCTKSVESIIAITGTGCNYNNSLSMFKKSRRLMLKSSFLNSRNFGDIDAIRQE